MPQEELNTANGQRTLNWHVYTRARRRHTQSPWAPGPIPGRKNHFHKFKRTEIIQFIFLP